MKLSDRTKGIGLTMGGFFVAAAVVAFVAMAAFPKTSDSGAISTALSRCRSLGKNLQLFLMDHPDGFDSAKHGLAELELQPTAFRGWGTTAENYLIRRKVDGFPGGTEVVAVCSLKFYNVPQPAWWYTCDKTPGHAALLGDGTAKVISPAEFAALDLKQFVPLSSLKGFETKTAQAGPPRE